MVRDHAGKSLADPAQLDGSLITERRRRIRGGCVGL
jgi:hypothetical protein